jgi:excisionase family DNA binding protein
MRFGIGEEILHGKPNSERRGRAVHDGQILTPSGSTLCAAGVLVGARLQTLGTLASEQCAVRTQLGWPNWLGKRKSGKPARESRLHAPKFGGGPSMKPKGKREVSTHQRADPRARLFTIFAAAKMLHLSPTWLYERTRKNAIPHHRFGRYIRFTEADLDDIITMASRPNSDSPEKRVKSALLWD